MEMGERPLKVLLIEDDEDDYVLVRDLLHEVVSQDYELEWVQSCNAALETIRSREHDVCLLDYRLGHRSGLELLRDLMKSGYKAPIIFLTGQGGYELDIEAMRAGAADYLVKDQIRADLLERSIRYSIERKHAEDQLGQHRHHLEELVQERTTRLEQVNRSLQLEMVERKLAETELERLIVELQEALAKVKVLSGFLPICSSCKKIRDDSGYWRQIEAYIRDHSEADFTHGICPECAQKLYPQFYRKQE
jgi:FixJ family two-component response regulator